MICSPASCFCNSQHSYNRNRSHGYQEGKQGSLANPEGNQHYTGKRKAQQKGERQQQQGEMHHPLLKMSSKGGGRYLFTVYLQYHQDGNSHLTFHVKLPADTTNFMVLEKVPWLWERTKPACLFIFK